MSVRTNNRSFYLILFYFWSAFKLAKRKMLPKDNKTKFSFIYG